jgi:hypothetical protein
MYLFTRRGRLTAGRNRDAITWAVEVTAHVNTVSDAPTTLWSSVLGPEVGTLAWSTFAPDLRTIETTMDRLQADDAFAELVDRGAQFMQGGADDGLAQILHGEPDLNRTVTYVTIVQAVCANRNLARGLGVGVEIAQMAEKITGTPTMFVTGATGAYGGVAWISGFEDIRELEAEQQALAADAGWLDFLDREAGTAYQQDPQLTTSRIYRRLA